MKRKLIAFLTIIIFPLILITGFSSWVIVGDKSATVGKAPILRNVCHIGTTYYTSIEGALKKAKSGDVVHVLLNKDNPAVINYDCSIPSGVTLNIPYENDKLQTNGEAEVFGTSYVSLSTNVTNIVRINSNVTLTVDSGGTLVIGGVLSGGNGGHAFAGQTAGAFARLVLSSNAKIESYGTIRCCGYIIEESNNNSSKVINHNGSNIYLPFILRDFRGGSTMSAIWNARDNYACPPFNQFEIRNVTCKNIIKYGSSLYVYANLAATALISQKNYPATVNFIGTTNSFFIQLTSSNYSEIHFKYNSSEVCNVDFYGGAKLNTMKMDAAGTEVDTVYVYFPLTWRLNITLNQGGANNEVIYDASKQLMKFMPGFSMIVNEGCKFKTTNLISYTSFYDKTDANTGSNIGGSLYAKNKAPANFEVYGKYTLLEGSTFAGTIIKGEEAVFSENIVNGTSMTINEALIQSGSSFSTKIEQWNVIKETTLIVNEEELEDKTIFSVGVTKWTGTYYTPSFTILEFQSSNITETKTKLLPKNTIINPMLNTNIRTANYNSNYYQKDTALTINGKTCYFTVVPSTSEMGSVDTAKVTISGNVSQLAQNSTCQLTATSTNISNVQSYTTKFSWSSSSTSIATVDSNGRVKGISPGVVTITATSLDAENVSASVTIEITNPNHLVDANISISGTQSGDGARDVTLSIVGNPSSAIKSVSWEITSNPDGIASLSTNTGLTTKVSLTDKGDKNDRTVEVTATIISNEGATITRKTTLTESKDSACFARGTKILMANGKYNNIENIKVGDMIKTFNHHTGKLENQFVTFIPYKEYDYFKILELEFSNGTKVKVIVAHGFMNYYTKLYEEISIENVDDKIGNEYLFFDEEGKLISSKLKSYEIYEEYTESYSLASAYNLNHIIDGALCMSDDIQGLYNYFALDEEFKYDIKLMNQDIGVYGLLSYSSVADFMSYDIYEWFNVQYLSISIGKGMITMDIMREYIRKYA